MMTSFYQTQVSKSKCNCLLAPKGYNTDEHVVCIIIDAQGCDIISPSPVQDECGANSSGELLK